MKKFYILFFVGFILISALLYISIWWFLGGVAIIILFTVYYFYAARLKAMDAGIEDLELQVEGLQAQLDTAILKEEKASREALQVRQVKQKLLTIISHEIRTPMNGVLGMSLLLADSKLNKEQEEYVSTIKSSGEKLLATVNEILVNDILDYAKIDRKDKKLENINFDLRDSIEEVLEMFAAKAGKKNIDLVYEIDQPVPLQLSGDSKRLREVLMNLVENAVKFTQEGEIVITVKLVNDDTNGLVLHFSIRDTGIGMTFQEKEQLFYETGRNEFRSEEDQPGRGLIISRKQVALMGGQINVESQPGAGSTFTFDIHVNRGLPIAGSSSNRENLVKLAGKKVLVTDDNISTRTMVIRQLEAWNIIASGAESAMAALELLSQYDFDLVITDRNMEPIDGLHFAKSIKNKYDSMPVMLMDSSGGLVPVQEPSLFDAIISKPLRYHKLQHEVLRVFNKAADAVGEKQATETENLFAEKFPLKILIAEDNLINQKIAIKILTRIGYQPAIANNGKEAVEMVTNSSYDIILMDIQMPVMDGLEATRTIRSSLTVQPVIMAMTANVMQGDRDLCMQAGMDDYISKPINIDQLLSSLEKWSINIRQRK